MAESNGVWLDKDSGKVVKKPPARGRQLVPPGKDVTADQLKAITAQYGDVTEPSTPAPAGEPDAKTVTTTGTKAAPAKAAAPKK